MRSNEDQLASRVLEPERVMRGELPVPGWLAVAYVISTVASGAVIIAVLLGSLP